MTTNDREDGRLDLRGTSPGDRSATLHGVAKIDDSVRARLSAARRDLRDRDATFALRARFTAELWRQRGELDLLEQIAREAEPEGPRAFGWASMSMDTGLTELQEDFVLTWSPHRVLSLCRAHRSMLDYLGDVVDADTDQVGVEQAFALLRQFSIVAWDGPVA